MKICSYSVDDKSGYGLVVDSGVIDLGARTGYPSLMALIAAGKLDQAAEFAREEPTFLLEEITFLPVLPDAQRIFCVGTNYAAHVKEAQDVGVARVQSAQPLIFFRLGQTLVGHKQSIVRPAVSQQLDYECELAVIIGKSGRYISQADALSHVAGYSCFNDASARDWQFHTSQVIPGKNFPLTGAFGPWLVSADEIPDPQALTVETKLNGQVLQSACTSDMIFNVAFLISYLSFFQHLQPGDVIATGTPSGVGFAREPKLFMVPGDEVVVSVSGVGSLVNPIAAEAVPDGVDLTTPAVPM